MFASSFPYAATRISNEGDFDKRRSVTGRMAPVAYCSRPLGLAYGLLLSGGVLVRPVCDRAKTLAIAKRLAAAASKGACQLPGNAPECLGSLAGVNDPGDLIELETFDGTQGPSVDMATKKAKTAPLYHRPTSMFHEAVTNGTSMSSVAGSFPDMMTALGGVPLSVNGRMIGGFGCGGNPQVAGCRAGRVEEDYRRRAVQMTAPLLMKGSRRSM